MGFNPEFLNQPHKRGNPEAQIQLQIIHYCKAKGYVIGKIKNKGSRLGNRFIQDPYAFLGLPDLLLFANNKMFFIEVKSPKGLQSEHQVLFNDLCNKAGIIYILAHSLEEIQAVIK